MRLTWHMMEAAEGAYECIKLKMIMCRIHGDTLHTSFRLDADSAMQRLASSRTPSTSLAWIAAARYPR